MKTKYRMAVLICLMAAGIASCDPGPYAGLTAISVTPAEAFMAINASLQFKAFETYSDNVTVDALHITWSSSDAGVASITDSGLATGVAVGTTTITASWTNPGGDVYSGSSILNVISSTLISIEVSPANPSSALNADTQFIATGTYADNSSINLTRAVTWSSSSPFIASISNMPNSSGKATSLAVGTAMITATEVATSISGTTTIAVTH